MIVSLESRRKSEPIADAMRGIQWGRRDPPWRRPVGRPRWVTRELTVETGRLCQTILEEKEIARRVDVPYETCLRTSWLPERAKTASIRKRF